MRPCRMSVINKILSALTLLARNRSKMLKRYSSFHAPRSCSLWYVLVWRMYAHVAFDRCNAHHCIRQSSSAIQSFCQIYIPIFNDYIFRLFETGIINRQWWICIQCPVFIDDPTVTVIPRELQIITMKRKSIKAWIRETNNKVHQMRDKRYQEG